MNFHNCFVIQAIANRLKESINNETLTDCFSNSIDELTLQFQSVQLRCLFFNGFLYFDFSENMIGKNRLFKPQFQEIKSLTLRDIVVHPFERSFHLVFDHSFELYFKCHGRKSNVILFNDHHNIDIFKNNIETDNSLQKHDIYKPQSIEFHPQVMMSEKLFEQQYPFLPHIFFKEIQTQANHDFFNQLLMKYQSIKGFSFDETTLDLNPSFTEGNVLNDISRYTQFALRKLTFDTKKQQLIQSKTKLLNEKKAYLKGNLEALKIIETQRNPEELGHIILSNFHLIKPELNQQELFDIYHNNHILLKYDPKLSAAENADKYFKKAKGTPIAKRLLKEKIDKAQLQINTLQNELLELFTSQHLKQLKPFINDKDKKNNVQELPYKFFQFENYDILVGKHAESNEKLLNYYSDKNDIWLHAKDVSGSHVIIKVKKGLTTPDKVLQKAASLAAYYSKNRNQSLVTVMYTLRKFVRKIKGADKGKVSVSQENSLLATPSNQ